MSGSAREHYDARARETSGDRRRSVVLPLRKANNAVKSALLEKALRDVLHTSTGDDRNVVCVLDLGCGRGGDLPKWGALSEAHGVTIDYRGIDVSHGSLQELRKRARSLAKRWPALAVTVVAADFCQPHSVPSDWPQADIVSAQFSLHYAFGSLASASALFDTIGSATKPGALLVGTIVDADQLTQKWASEVRLEEDAGGDRVFAVAQNAHFEAKIDLANLQRLVGAAQQRECAKRGLDKDSNDGEDASDTWEKLCSVAYFFSLDRCVDNCVEYLVDRKLFENLAKKVSFCDALWHNFCAFNLHNLLSQEQSTVHGLYCTFFLRKV